MGVYPGHSFKFLVSCVTCESAFTSTVNWFHKNFFPKPKRFQQNSRKA
jgi:hypothetical protein